MLADLFKTEFFIKRDCPRIFFPYAEPNVLYIQPAYRIERGVHKRLRGALAVQVFYDIKPLYFRLICT